MQESDSERGRGLSTTPHHKTPEQLELRSLERERIRLLARLAETEAVLRAIEDGGIDAVVMNGPAGPHVYPLQGKDHPYHVLVNAMNEGAVTLDARGVVLFCNPRLGAMLAVAPDGIRGEPLARWVVAEHQARLASLVERARSGASREQIDLLAADGSALCTHVSLNAIPDEPDLLVGVVTDLTQAHHHAELAVAAARARDAQKTLQLALDAAQLGVWSWSSDTGVFEGDSLAHALHGKPPLESVSGTEALNMVASEDRAKVQQAARTAVAGRSGYEIEYRIACATGEERWARVFARCEEDANGQPKLVGLVQDVTKRRLDEEELRLADRRKDEFLAMLAHELKNPLAPIRSAAQALERVSSDQTAQPVVARLTEMIGRQVSHMSRLVDELLDVSRITRNQTTLRSERLDVGAMAQQAIEIARPNLETKQQRLRVMLSDTPVYVQGDRTRLCQVIANLLDNATKYSAPGSEISVEVRNDESSDRAVVRVSDHGIGIAPDLLPRVFDVFQQASRTLDRSQGGLGLGLTIVRHIVELHDGTVEARSEGEGKGSTFTVFLPLARLIVDPEPVAPNPSTQASMARRILIVDDNEDSVASMELLLQLDGHEVRTATNGVLALEIVDSFHPEIVLLDLGLPGMDGLEVARRIRDRPESRDVSLIAITGYGQSEYVENTRRAGFDRHVTKPIDAATLSRLVAEAGSRTSR